MHNRIVSKISIVRPTLSSPGKDVTSLRMVSATPDVCNVVYTGWPVNAASSVALIVSGSRHSPTKMSLGLRRRALRTPSANVGICLGISD